MSEPEPLREIIARHGLQASKALGQNFILDRQLLARIAAVPGDVSGDTVYEVGPGPGGLTRALLEGGARVVAVERDRRFLPALAELQQQFPNMLEVLDADALRINEVEVAGPRASRAAACGTGARRCWWGASCRASACGMPSPGCRRC